MSQMKTYLQYLENISSISQNPQAEEVDPHVPDENISSEDAHLDQLSVKVSGSTPTGLNRLT